MVENRGEDEGFNNLRKCKNGKQHSPSQQGQTIIRG